MVHLYNRIDLSNTKEQIINKCKKFDESQRHYAKRKKAVSKSLILYYAFLWHSQKGKVIGTKKQWLSAVVWGGRRCQ